MEQRIRVTWETVEGPWPRCDFCTAGLLPGGRYAALRDLVAWTELPILTVATPGDWSLCAECQAAVGIENGQDSVPLEAVAAYHREVMAKLCVAYGMPAERAASLQRELRYRVEHRTPPWGGRS